MKCYSFLTNKEYTQALIRLTKMVRGIGDPLVAAYARAYLCRVGMAIAPESRTHLLPNFTDYLSTFSQVGSEVKARIGFSLPLLILLPVFFLLPSFPSFLPLSLLTCLSLQLNSDQVQNTLALQSLDMPTYMHLYVPAIEWILQCVAHKASDVSGSLLCVWCVMWCVMWCVPS